MQGSQDNGSKRSQDHIQLASLVLSTSRLTVNLSSAIVVFMLPTSCLLSMRPPPPCTLFPLVYSAFTLHSLSCAMAPFFIRTQNKPRSLETPASVASMSPQVVALICASVLIFLVSLSSGIVLIRRRRLRHRTQGTTQVQAQVQLPGPVAQPQEKVENVSPSPSSSSQPFATVPLLPTTTAPRSGAVTENPVEKLMFKTSAALSKVDKYTTLPLRRARQARQAKTAQKNLVFDFSTPLATLDAEIAHSESNNISALRVSHQPSSTRSISLTVGTDPSGTMPSRSEFLPNSRAVPPGNGGQSALRPSPTVKSMEARPLEADAAALPDAETMFVSGSLPSFPSIPSVASLSTVCQPAIDGDTGIEDGVNKHPHSGLDCETPRKKEHRVTSGTPSSSCTSVSTFITTGDSSFASDVDTVCDVVLGKVPISDKAFKFDAALPLSISMFSLSLEFSSGKGNDAVRLHTNRGPDDLSTVTKYSGTTKFEDGDLTTLALADSSF